MVVMAGLLDFINSPEGQGLLGAGFGALASAGRGGLLNTVGAGGLAGLNAYTGAQDRITQGKRQAMHDEMFGMQLDALRRAEQDRKDTDALAQQFYRSPVQNVMAAPGQAGPTNARAAMLPTAQASFDMPGFIEAYSAKNPMAGVEMRAKMAALQPKPIQVGAGETLLDPTTMRPIYTAPKEQPKSDVAKLIAEMQALPDGDPMRAVYQNAITKATTHQPGTSVSVNTGQKGFENELKLRGDFRSEPVYKAYQEVQSAYSQIGQALNQGTPAGDLAAATKIMKILDPGSVVRESELGMAMAATGLLDRVSNYANMLVTGQKLTPQQRVEFKKLADSLYGEAVNAYNAKRTEYEGIANDYGMNPGRVTGKPASKVINFGELK